MARKQKQLFELILKKEKVLELYESTAYKAQNEQTLYDPNSIEFARLASQVSAAQSSYISSMTRLRTAENETSHDLTLLERDYIPSDFSVISQIKRIQFVPQTIPFWDGFPTWIHTS